MPGPDIVRSSPDKVLILIKASGPSVQLTARRTRDSTMIDTVVPGFDVRMARNLYQTLSTVTSFGNRGDRFESFARGFGTELFNRLLEPCEEFISSSTELEIVYDGIYFPMELAFNGSEFLCMRLKVSNKLMEVPDRRLSAYPDRLGAGGSGPVQILSIGNMDADVLSRFDALGGVSVVRPEGGNEDILGRMHGKNFQVVHFSGHGIAEGRFCEPRLLTQEGPEQPPTVLDPDWIMRASNRQLPIVFLNACATGSLGERPSHLTLASSFLASGAESCVVPMLPLLDASAHRFALNFYASALRGATVGESVYHARRKTWAETGDLMTTLSYALFGDPNAVLSAPRST